MGAQHTANSSNSGTLSFLTGSERTLVTVLEATDIIQRNRVIDTLLHLSSLRTEGTQVYVAAPRILGATLDSQILRSSGIGLLLYDDRRIDETVKPQPAHPSTETPQTLQDHSPDATLLAELDTLKSKYADLERDMSQMMAEFKSFRENTLTPMPVSSELDRVPFNSFRQPETPFELDTPGEGPLPSFFTNNPWLDVLSKRGRTEATPIAG
jgi:hypothetical protein